MPISIRSNEFLDREYDKVFFDEDLILRDNELYEAIKKFKNKQKCAQKFPGNPNILCAYAFVKSNISRDLAKNIVCKLLSGGGSLSDKYYSIRAQSLQ